MHYHLSLLFLVCLGMCTVIEGSLFMSDELKSYLYQQVEQIRTILMGMVNVSVSMAQTMAPYCKSRNIDIKRWERVLPDVLHSLHSLLCTAINTIPHERIFTYSCRSAFGESIPSWLSSPGHVLLKRQALSMNPLLMTWI